MGVPEIVRQFKMKKVLINTLNISFAGDLEFNCPTCVLTTITSISKSSMDHTWVSHGYSMDHPVIHGSLMGHPWLIH